MTKSFEYWSSKPTNCSILQKNMLAKASRFVTSSLEKAFFAWGLTVARHPFPVSIINAAITVITANSTRPYLPAIFTPWHPHQLPSSHQVILGSLILSAIFSLGLLRLRMEHQVVLSDVDYDNVGADIDNDANYYDAYDKKDHVMYLRTRPTFSGFPPPPTTICIKLGSR